MDRFGSLPEELILKIFSSLDAKDLLKCALVCRAWANISNNDMLWHDICARKGVLHFGDKLKAKNGRECDLETGTLVLKRKGTERNVFGGKSYSSGFFHHFSKWKSIYKKAQQLDLNWRHGKYKVQSIYRAHRCRISCMVSNGSDDNLLKIWDVTKCRCVSVLNDFTDSVTCLALTDCHLVAGSYDRHVRVYQLGSYGLLNQMECTSGPVTHVSSYGSKIAAVTSVRVIEVFDFPSGDCLLRMRGHTDDIEVLLMDDYDIITTSWDSTIRIWNLKSGFNTFVLSSHTEAVLCCQFDEKKIVSGGGDGLVIIWNRQSGEELQTLSGHTEEVYCLAYNESIIASGSADSTIIIWNLNGHLLHVFRNHFGIVRFLSLQGNHKLISAGDCKRICLWDFKSGVLLNVAHRQPIEINSMYVDDTKIVTSSPYSPGSLVILNYWPESS